MKQTSVDWLFQQLWETPKDKFTWYSILEQAKQMEKEQSIAELRHKDGTPMRKYNSPKLQEIEMENKQTAIEWLVEKIQDANPSFKFDALIRQAKAMHKDEHSKTWDKALDTYEERGSVYVRAWEDFDEYYNQTFKSE